MFKQIKMILGCQNHPERKDRVKDLCIFFLFLIIESLKMCHLREIMEMNWTETLVKCTKSFFSLTSDFKELVITWFCLFYLFQTDEQEVINFLLNTEIIPLCLRIMEVGSELSKTVSYIGQTIPLYWFLFFNVFLF